MDSKKIKDIIFKCKNGITKAIRYRGSKYIFGAIIGVTILVLTLTVSSPTVINKSYAAGNGYERGGYYTNTDNIYDEDKAFTNGYFYINLYKNSTRFAYALFKVSHNETAANAHALYTKLQNDSYSYYFDDTGTGSSGYENWIKVGDSASQAYGTKMYGIAGTDDQHYEYAAPTIKIKIPKGYRYSYRTNGYDSTRFSKPTALSALYCSTSPYKDDSSTSFNKSNCYTQTTDDKFVKMLYADSPSINNSASMSFTAQASNRWTSGGRLQINVMKSTGLATRKGEESGYTSKYYRARQSYTVTFVPNETTITFKANGGSGSDKTQTKTYDQSATLTSNTFTRANYVFDGWNTETDGSGTSYSNGQSLEAKIWPGTQDVTLYAQWKASSATAGTWCGSTVDSIGQHSTALGWRNGYGYIHLGKCGVDETDINNCKAYSTNEIKSVYSYTGASTQTAAYLTYINGHQVSSTFNIEAGYTTYFQFVGTSTTSSTSSFNGNSASTYIYFNGPTVKMRPPKGYKYWTYKVGYPSVWSAYLEFSFRTTSGSGTHTHAFADTPGPYANDNTWVQGSLTLNNAAIGHRTYSNYRAYEALCIAFKPNTRTFIYNANGGSGTVSNTRYVYGNVPERSGMTVADNSFTRSGYKFIGWNTASNGSGTWYYEGQDIPEDTWPGDDSSVTLYAQWTQIRTATIYYNASNGDGTTNIQTASTNCSSFDEMVNYTASFSASGSNLTVHLADSGGTSVSGLSLAIWEQGDHGRPYEVATYVTNSSGNIVIPWYDEMVEYYNNGYSYYLSLEPPFGDGDYQLIDNLNSTIDNIVLVGHNKNTSSACNAKIPSEVLDSVGQYGSNFSGVASSTGTMSKTANSTLSYVPLSSSSATFYSIYSTPVLVYYYEP